MRMKGFTLYGTSFAKLADEAQIVAACQLLMNVYGSIDVVLMGREFFAMDPRIKYSTTREMCEKLGVVTPTRKDLNILRLFSPKVSTAAGRNAIVTEICAFQTIEFVR